MRSGPWPWPPSVPEVHELQVQLHLVHLLAEQLDGRLEVVLVLAGHPELVPLDAPLHLHLRLLEDPDQLPGLLRVDALQEQDGLLGHAQRRLLDLLGVQAAQGHAALDQLGLEHVVGGLEPALRGRLEEDGRLLLRRGDLGLRALEVVAGLDLLLRLVERVVELGQVDLRDDVKRGHLGAFYHSARSGGVSPLKVNGKETGTASPPGGRGNSTLARFLSTHCSTLAFLTEDSSSFCPCTAPEGPISKSTRMLPFSFGLAGSSAS